MVVRCRSGGLRFARAAPLSLVSATICHAGRAKDAETAVREKASWIGRELRAHVTRARHEAWSPRKRVGVIGSGGLSHFVVDEALDHHVLEILAKKDAEAVEHLPMQLVDYVSSYRSEAGTGVGMAFAVWR